MPFFSIIVPIYNTETRLKRCIDSLVNQTFKDIEIILVDDGSTDKSSSICDEYANKDSRIKVIHQKNAGQGIARNSGLKVANGEYIAFLDSDDYMDSNSYGIIKEAIDKTDADLCAFGYCQLSESGKVVYQSIVHKNEYCGKEIKKEFILHFFGDDPVDEELSGVSSCMSVYRKSIVVDNKIRFLSERKVFSEDTIFNLDFCKYAKKVITIPDILYNYCLASNSFTQGYQAGRLELTEKFCDILKDYSRQYDICDDVADRINMVLWVSIMDCIKQESARISQNGLRHSYNNIKKLVIKESVKKTSQQINKKGIGIKQRILSLAVQNEDAFICMILGYIRVLKGR